MAVSDTDYKILWGRAAGRCSNPGCQQDLTIILQNSESYNIGEMAHIIAKKPKGPRGLSNGGKNSYDNLILLCPTCHCKVDKAPKGKYTIEMLDSWKMQHEIERNKLGSENKFDNFNSLKFSVKRLLMENKTLLNQLGPESNTAKNNPGSNLHAIWNLRKLDTILPNNRKIINIIEANSHLIDEIQYESFLLFKVHAESFENHQYAKQDSYPIFPKIFEVNFIL
ncbi:MAG: HNH endonuclease [Tatlockia sp.]|nr:HNH endonuclease [Tatlockia sp.]